MKAIYDNHGKIIRVESAQPGWMYWVDGDGRLRASAPMTANPNLDLSRLSPQENAMKPTIGRIVHFYPSGKGQVEAGTQPCAATIAFVHQDEKLINIGYLSTAGVAMHKVNVPLLGPNDTMPETGDFCIWPSAAMIAASNAASEHDRKVKDYLDLAEKTQKG